MTYDIFFYRDTIENWIWASRTVEHLNVCEQAIATFIRSRFQYIEHPAILAETESYLATKLIEMKKKLPAVAAGSGQLVDLK